MIDPVHHFSAVQQSKVLGPMKMGNVGGEFLGSLVQPRQIWVGQVIAGLVAQTFGQVDVVGSDFIADAARAGVEEGLELFVFINTNFNNIVAEAKCALLYSQIYVKGI